MGDEFKKALEKAMRELEEKQDDEQGQSTSPKRKSKKSKKRAHLSAKEKRALK
jgi:carbamoylphosphate synthase large subunit